MDEPGSRRRTGKQAARRDVGKARANGKQLQDGRQDGDVDGDVRVAYEGMGIARAEGGRVSPKPDVSVCATRVAGTE